MKHRARPVGPTFALAAVLMLIAAACGSTESTDQTDAAAGAPFVADPAAPTEAVEAGAVFLESQYGSIDIASLSVISYVGANWQVPTLVAADDAAQERLATADLDPEEAAMVRLADPTRVADPTLAREFAPGSTSATLSVVLRCDHDPLTNDDVMALDALVEGGGYDATHAALAVTWLDELGCEVSDERQRHDCLVDVISGELAATGGMTDLALEQSAVLHYLDAGDHIPADWLDRVLAAQRTDGGWGERVSTWYMTLLATWTILAETEPRADVPMVGEAS